jgi:hypothetical protein
MTSTAETWSFRVRCRRDLIASHLGPKVEVAITAFAGKQVLVPATNNERLGARY